MHIVQSPYVGFILRHVGDGHRAVINAILTGHICIIFIYPIILCHGLRIDTRHGHLTQRLIGHILLCCKIRIQVTIPEVGIATRTARPLPLSLGRQRNLCAHTLAHHAAELHSLIPRNASHGLCRTVGCIAGAYVILPELRREAAVVRRIYGVILLVGNLRFGHPEGAVNLYHRCGSIVQTTIVITHDERSGRDSHKRHLHAIGQLNGATVSAVTLRHLLCLSLGEGESLALYLLIVRILHLLANSRRLGISLEPLLIFLQLTLPLYACTIAILVGKFDTALILIVGAIPNLIIHKSAVMRSIEVNPRIERAPLLIGELHAVVTRLQDTHQLRR